MFALMKEYQLDIMLFLCGACATMVFLLLFTRFLSPSRKRTLIFMEVVAFFLLWFDRMAYIYAGDLSLTGYYMVRISNFFVFFLTSAIVFGFNRYLMDWTVTEGGMKSPPRRLREVGMISALGMALAVISAFTNFYYYFDGSNRYHRGSGFLVAYIIPVICPIIQYTVIRQYRKIFSRLIYISMVLYIFVPIGCGILQIFAYGISIVNMSMVAVSIALYIFSYIDINDEVERAHRIELENMEIEQTHMKRLFDQTATAFVSAVEKKDSYATGVSARVADYARRIAEMSGKSADECEKVYYSALLHDVGMIGIPDKVIKNEADPGKWDAEAMRLKPVLGREILSNITEYPYLVQGAYSSHERYNGTGYPEGLKGEEIPEIARIIGVADAYVAMTTRKRFRDARPSFVAREAFVKGAGETFDPEFADIMVKIIDMDSGAQAEETENIETEISCGEYRDQVLRGIPVENDAIRISFRCTAAEGFSDGFSAPSIILFDSYDRRIHDDKKTIDEYRYLEYGEFWFDDHEISTGVRRIETVSIDRKQSVYAEKKKDADTPYEIVAVRFEDHVRLIMDGPVCRREMIIALPDSTRSVYIGLTGEHCEIRDIVTEPTGETAGAGDIPRIAEAVSFIDHMESDIKNVQVDRTRSASTDGIELKDRLKLVFHTTTLPGASLVWHCPYVVLFYSENGCVDGPDYREYALIKLNGENEGTDEFAQNRFVMKRKDAFPGWKVWKETNKAGMECTVSAERKGNRIELRTENLGIAIENTSTIAEDKGAVYVALTGDQVALTDIRIL
ncbi:MAG: HD domain-containing protein [Lachnospiraceae bacterium]|nr:HD domain-containing protein [Lachnospiraceae bacterium]